MNSVDFTLITIFLVLIIIAYLYISPQIKKKRLEHAEAAAVERERSIQAAIANQAAEAAQAKIFAETQASLEINRYSEMQKTTPKYISEAIYKFKDNYKSNPASFKSMQEFSPLACFGYKVGKSSELSEQQRHEIIHYTWYANIPRVIPSAYAHEWGQPGTYKRFAKIVSHISMLASLRASQKNLEVAVAHWTADAKWFESGYRGLAHQYRQFGFR